MIQVGNGRHSDKFCDKRSNRYWDMAIWRFSKWRHSAILYCKKTTVLKGQCASYCQISWRSVRARKATDPFELSGHVGGNAALDGEREYQTAREVREQIGEILQQLAPERAAIDNVKPRLRKVQTAQQRQIFRQKHPAVIKQHIRRPTSKQ